MDDFENKRVRDLRNALDHSRQNEGKEIILTLSISNLKFLKYLLMSIEDKNTQRHQVLKIIEDKLSENK